MELIKDLQQIIEKSKDSREAAEAIYKRFFDYECNHDGYLQIILDKAKMTNQTFIGRCKLRDLQDVKMMITYLMYLKIGSYQKMRYICRRTHATIIYRVKMHKFLYETDHEYKEKFDQLKQEINEFYQNQEKSILSKDSQGESICQQGQETGECNDTHAAEENISANEANCV